MLRSFGLSPHSSLRMNLLALKNERFKTDNYTFISSEDEYLWGYWEYYYS